MINKWVAISYLNSPTVYYVYVMSHALDGFNGPFVLIDWEGGMKFHKCMGLWPFAKIESAKIVRNQRLRKKLEMLKNEVDNRA